MRWLSIFPLVLALAGLLPMLAGLGGIALPAFYSETTAQLSLEYWRNLFAWPGLAESLALSLFSSIFSTIIALILGINLAGIAYCTPQWRRWLSPASALLAIPHAAWGAGLVLLLAPSGWLLRLFSPWLTGLQRPPDWLLINDPYAISLTLAIALKEIPFILLMVLSIAKPLNIDRQLQIICSLGYSPLDGWHKVIVPQLLPQLRLPIYALLAYSLSIVDISLLIGPSRPPTFALLIWQWLTDPQLLMQGHAAAGALLLLSVTLLLMCIYRLSETLWLAINKMRFTGNRKVRRAWSMPIWIVGLLITLGAYLTLMLWSIAQRWRFPSTLPEKISLDTWLQTIGTLKAPLLDTVFIAAIAIFMSLILVLGILEWQKRYNRNIPVFLLLSPLLLPQLSLMFGLQVMAARFNLLGHFGLLVWGHILFIFPYIYLSLRGAWESYDERLTQIGISLGKNHWQLFWHIKLPLLSHPICTAAALGFAVSLGLYLPTLALGAGRVSTLATETVAYASGIDRKLAAVSALWQTLLPLIVFISLTRRTYTHKYAAARSR